MTIANVSTAFAFNTLGTKQNCYTETTELGKTVFNSPGQAVIVTYDTVTTPTGNAITINTNGIINLAANITYRFDMHCESVPTTGVDPNEDFFQGFIMYNATTATRLYPAYRMNTTGTLYYTTTQAENVLMLAFMPDGTPPNTTTQPQTWQYPQQIQNASIGVQAISGENL